MLLAIAYWAGSTVARPEHHPVEVTEPQLYTVNEGTVAEYRPYPAQASWREGPTASSPGTGTLTSLSLPPDGLIESGDVVYSLNLSPVVVISGDVPAFRDLTEGIHGEDVEQLQRYLIESGFLDDAADGRFGVATTAAVQRWQEADGLRVDGVVNRGEVLFFPLPARVYPADGIRVGAIVSEGSPVLRSVVGYPSFGLVPASGNREATVSPGSEVTVNIGEREIVGVTGLAERQQDGTTVIPIEAADGETLCDAECAAALPIPGPVELSARLVLAEARSGPVVPVSALRSDPGGETFVTLADGASCEVQILVSYGGLAVVSGLDVGASIKLFGD